MVLPDNLPPIYFSRKLPNHKVMYTSTLRIKSNVYIILHLHSEHYAMYTSTLWTQGSIHIIFKSTQWKQSNVHIYTVDTKQCTYHLQIYTVDTKYTSTLWIQTNANRIPSKLNNFLEI